MNAVEWSETEQEAVERGLRRYGLNVVAASIARQVLDDLAPFVADREAAARDAGFDAGRADRMAQGAVRQISDLIDSTYPASLDREAWAWRRVMKVAEEVGEVNEAMLGWLGENPRKGVTHTSEDVRRELLDVALAALGACAHLDADSDPFADLHGHAEWVLDRLRAALEGDR